MAPSELAVIAQSPERLSFYREAPRAAPLLWCSVSSTLPICPISESGCKYSYISWYLWRKRCHRAGL